MADIKLQLFSKKVNTTKKGKTINFRTFFTKMNLVVAGEEDKGKQTKYITVKFRKTIDTSKFIRGYLICDPKDVNAPFKYEVTTDENGDTLYPTLWVRGYKEYIEKVQSHVQSDFIIEDDQDELDPYAIPDENDAGDDLPF